MKSTILAVAFLVASALTVSAQVTVDPTIQQLQADLSAMGTSQHHAMEDLGVLVQAYQKGQVDLADAEAQKAELIKWLQTAQAQGALPQVKGAP